VVNPQQIQKLQPEFIEPGDSVEKSLLTIEKVFPVVRQEKVNVWIVDDPTKYDTLIWSKGCWNLKQWAGKGSINLSNEIMVDARTYSPENIFYELFVTDTQIEHYPSQTLFGILQLDYNEYVQSNTIYKVNDYSVSYTSSSEVIDGNTFNFANPNVTNSYIKISQAKITVKGYMVEWHGQDWTYENDFTTSNQLLKWSVGKWTNNVYSGGSIGLPGTFTNTTISNGYLKATAATGSFVSNTLLTSSKNIEKVKFSKKEILNTGSVVYYISTDEGNNYQEITVFDEFIDIANVGKKLKIKIEITGNALVDWIYIDTDEFSLTSTISSTNTKLELGNSTEGFTEVNNDVFSNVSVEDLRYKISCIYPDSTLFLKSVRVEYVV